MNHKQARSTAFREAVENAVSDAEKRTSAEIVCAISTESGRYDRAEGIGGILFSLIFLGMANWISTLSGEGSWAVNPGLAFGIQCGAVVIGFVLGNLFFSHVHFLRRLLVSQREMESECLRSAHYLFAARGLHKTEGKGGLLIFVSLFEHRIIIQTDQGILDVGGQELVDSIRDAATAELRSGRTLEAFTSAIETAVAGLEEKLPVSPDDRNELTDKLLVFHPRP